MEASDFKKLLLFVAFCSVLPSTLMAQTVPGAADPGRMGKELQQRQVVPKVSATSIESNVDSPIAAVPPQAQSIHLTLNEITVEGNTAFTTEQLRDIYAPYIGQKTTLATVYIIANKITERYRSAGYFLARTYVPAQEINNGKIKLIIAEGYIGAVEIRDESLKKQAIVRDYIDQLMAMRPINTKTLESILLRLNDLPGYSFSGVISPLSPAKDGAVELTLVPSTKAASGSIGFDNASSRFLGPNEVSASYSASLLPFQQTTVSGLTSVPTKKLNYGALKHTIAIAPDWSLDFDGSITKAKPGYTLDPLDLDSTSIYVDAAINYQWIRQRQENLQLKLTLDGRNTSTDALDSAFTRDRVRALRANASYDLTDHWNGYNTASVTLSHGLGFLGASDKGSPNLSRAEADPNFTKIEMALSRLQALPENFSLLASAQGQKASGPLFSVEEFGYGGTAFGRAYDSSELTGDHGISGSVELRYDDLPQVQGFAFQPYSFYDIGKVWNDDIGQLPEESGSSAGFGMRAQSADYGISANAGLAWALTRDADTPIYGQNASGPRILLQVNKSF